MPWQKEDTPVSGCRHRRRSGKTVPKPLALAGFLAGYSGPTREAYELDLRQYASWCHQHHLRPFQARRADIAHDGYPAFAGGSANKRWVEASFSGGRSR